MPAWWSRKSKSKSKTEPGSNKKDKSNSFDETLVRKAGGGSGSGSGSGSGPVPLPRPVSSPLPSINLDLTVAGSGSGSASASSLSSSGSDDTPVLDLYRYPEPINRPKGRSFMRELQTEQHVGEDKHQRSPDTSVPPKKEFHLLSGETSSDNIFNTAHCTRGHPLRMSPIHPRAISICPGSPKLRHDDLKSPPHPLPLPPSSPGSSSSWRSIQSQCKKGRLLGRGTFGHVYLGFNSERGQMCAIKEVEVISDDSNSKECLRQLNQEITLLSQLSHPNIVQYYGSELVDDTLSVYLEYVSGGSIHKLLNDYGPFKEPVIRNYTRQILSGLAYLHGRSTVHRDIKGANILVDPNGEVKLADFGMAKHMSANASIRSFKGSPYWMAPEVIMNGNGYNLSVDIWSLGCTILEMATSKPPWSQFEGVPAIFKIANSKDIPDIPDHLSLDAKKFLKLCLQRDPAARPTAAQLMDHPFVCDQACTKPTRSSMFWDTLPSLTDGSHRMATMDLSNRSVSPLQDRDYGVGHSVGFPSAYRKQSDLGNMRMNMSLPVSPCSSPLRQFKQHNRSCLPSPPHPAYSAGAINYSPINYSLYSSRPSNIFDPLPDIHIPQLKSQTPYGSPRR